MRPLISVTTRPGRPGDPRVVYDADGVTDDGIEYHVSGETAGSTRKRAQAQIDFCRANPAVAFGGFRLVAQDVKWFRFVTSGGGVMLFAARNRDAALARIACDFNDDSEVLDFVRGALDALNADL